MKTITAIYEDGVFKPTSPVSLKSGTEVDIVVPEGEEDAVAILKARFPGSFGGLPDKDAAEMMEAIEEEFERVDRDGWD